MNLKETKVTPFPAAEFIDVNGITLEVFSAGDPGGSPIVLCHGWPECAYSWRHQIAPLVDAGHHVMVPNQRGYGRSSRPEPVADYDIHHLCGDLLGLLDHFGHRDAVFVGHDWGAIVVWNLAMLHPSRVRGVVNLSVPFLERPADDPIDTFEAAMGSDFYIVHFNRRPGVADASFDANIENFLRNIYRTRQWHEEPRNQPAGETIIDLATSADPSGELMMSEADLAVFVATFKRSGFTGGLNWYRNFSRNWETTAEMRQRVDQPALMLHGRYDMVPQNPRLETYVPDVETCTLECGHWIQQEQPEETNRLILDWLARRMA